MGRSERVVGIQRPTESLDRKPSLARTDRWISVAMLGWLLFVGVGFYRFNSYAFDGAEPAQGVRCSLADSRVDWIPGAYRVLVFLHPQCPCTRATLEELQSLAAIVDDRLHIVVFGYCPPNATDEWFQAVNWELVAQWERAVQATQRPLNLERYRDVGAEMALRFGAEFSGHVLLFDPADRPLFSGGITSSRGHAGGSRGSTLMVDRIRNHRLPWATNPVLGCPLTAAQSAPATGIEVN